MFVISAYKHMPTQWNMPDGGINSVKFRKICLQNTTKFLITFLKLWDDPPDSYTLLNFKELRSGIGGTRQGDIITEFANFVITGGRLTQN